MKIPVQCSNLKCGRTLLVDRKFVGRRGECPSCGMVMIIRDQSAMAEKPTVFVCQKCGAKLRVVQGDEPKTGQCPKCGQKIRVPPKGAPTEAAAPSDGPSADPPPAAQEEDPAWGITARDTWEYSAFHGALESSDVVRASELAREHKIHPDLISATAQEVFDAFLTDGRLQEAMTVGAEFGLDLTRAHEAMLTARK